MEIKTPRLPKLGKKRTELYEFVKTKRNVHGEIKKMAASYIHSSIHLLT